MGASTPHTLPPGVFIQLTLCVSLCFLLQVSNSARIERHTASFVIHQTTGTWCIASSDASSSDLQNALDWACGQQTNQGNVDCTPISSGGQCYTPDTLAAHASYAFNAYFQKSNQAPEACNFSNCAQTTTNDPSTTSCSYPSSSSSLITTNVTSSPSFSSSNGARILQPRGHILWVSVWGMLTFAAIAKL